MIGGLRISLGALRRNAKALAALIRPSKLAPVVKGNAYGHGLIDVALALEPLASRICVYTLDEAIALRDGGITAPIIVLGPVAPQALGDAHGAKVQIPLWDAGSFLNDVEQTARKRNDPFSIHVKVNTGVNRFGFEPSQVAEAVAEIDRSPNVGIAGIFSHLASAEEMDSPYTLWQLDRFETALAQAKSALNTQGASVAAHIAASAAAMLWPQSRFDLSRIGIALYGLWPSAETRKAMNGRGVTLEEALQYHSELVATRDVEAGSAIGYGCTFHAPRAMRLGVVPLGYADGIPRALSNNGAFIVGGTRCPIVGRVFMNATILDISGAPQARSGAPVTLIGTDGKARVSADDWAAWSDTINYEIVTRLPSELPRSHLED
jgi:alanine racemase